MAKKKCIPAHIQKKNFYRPGQDQNLIKALVEVDDPRALSCNFQYSLYRVVYYIFSYEIEARLLEKATRNH